MTNSNNVPIIIIVQACLFLDAFYHFFLSLCHVRWFRPDLKNVIYGLTTPVCVFLATNKSDLNSNKGGINLLYLITLDQTVNNTKTHGTFSTTHLLCVVSSGVCGRKIQVIRLTFWVRIPAQSKGGTGSCDVRAGAVSQGGNTISWL